MRFIPIYNKEFSYELEQWLVVNGYCEIVGSTYGDEDFITIAVERREYMWCEHGFYPFCDPNVLQKFQRNDTDITLKILDKIRY